MRHSSCRSDPSARVPWARSLITWKMMVFQPPRSALSGNIPNSFSPHVLYGFPSNWDGLWDGPVIRIFKTKC